MIRITGAGGIVNPVPCLDDDAHMVLVTLNADVKKRICTTFLAAKAFDKSVNVLVDVTECGSSGPAVRR